MKPMKQWYELSAHDIACVLALKKMRLKDFPEEADPLYKDFSCLCAKYISKARGIKYGKVSYSILYMAEREKVIGSWQNFLMSLCDAESVDILGHIIVGGINDGQEVFFLPSRTITGVEISSQAIRRGRTRYPNISFEKADLLKYQPKVNFYDTYLMLRTIHLFNDDDVLEILTKAFSCLKKNGKIVISIPAGFLTAEGLVVFGQRITEGTIDNEKPHRDASRCAKLMTQVGFESVGLIDKKIELFVIGEKSKGGIK